MGLFSRKKKETTGGGTSGSATLSDGTVVTIQETVDCIGDSCPRPQLMTKKAVDRAFSGEVIEVLVDNPTSVEALPPMCNDLNATHLETIQEARDWRIYIQKD